MKTLKMSPEKIEKALPDAVRKQLQANARKAAEMEFFCNVDEEDWPKKDIWAALEKAGDSYESIKKITGGAVVWEPFEGYPARNLLIEMERFAFSAYSDMRDAIGVYLAGMKKEKTL